MTQNYQLRHHRAGGTGETLERIAGHALFTPAGETGGLDLGDVIAHQLELETKRRSILRAARAGVMMRDETVTGVSQVAYTLTLQEATPDNLATLLCALVGDDAEQPEQSGRALAFAGVRRGRTYDLGYFDLSACSVTVNGEQFAEGIDYTLDRFGGTLHVLERGTIPAGETITVVLDCGPVRSSQIVALGATAAFSRAGTLRIVEHDGSLIGNYTGGPFARVITFPCVLSRNSETSRSTAEFSSFEFRAVATGPVMVRRRTLPEPQLVARNLTLTVGSRCRRLGRLRAEAGARFRIR